MSIVPKIDLHSNMCVRAKAFTTRNTFDWDTKENSAKSRRRKKAKKKSKTNLNLILGRKRLEHVCCAECAVGAKKNVGASVRFLFLVFGVCVSVNGKRLAYKSAISNWINTINYPRSNFTIATFPLIDDATSKRRFVHSQHNTIHINIHENVNHNRNTVCTLSFFLSFCIPFSLAVNLTLVSRPDLHHNLYK